MEPVVLQDKSVAVVDIDHLAKSFSIVVKVNVPPMQLHTPEIQKMIAKKAIYATKYLVTEGLIPDPGVHNWNCEVIGIAI